MKDMIKIVNKIKATGVEGTESIHTLQEGIEALADNITFGGGKEAVALFKKFAIYDAEYVKENLTVFYKLIAKDVVAKENKELIKQGATKEDIERKELIDSLEGNKIVGYARVSSFDQKLDRQLIALEEEGCQIIFQEKKSGKNTDRPEFKKMMDSLKTGDTLIISELTRLARSTTDLFKIVGDLEAKGVAIKSLKETWLDTTTAQGRLMFTIMSGMAQFERELLLERQSEGIKVAVENGVKFGVKLNENADLTLAISLVKEGKYTKSQIAKMCHISRSTLYRECNKLGI